MRVLVAAVVLAVMARALQQILGDKPARASHADAAGAAGDDGHFALQPPHRRGCLMNIRSP
jgi:hypothetical protein